MMRILGVCFEQSLARLLLMERVCLSALHMLAMWSSLGLVLFLAREYRGRGCLSLLASSPPPTTCTPAPS